MLDTLLGTVTSNPMMVVGGGASAAVLWALKLVPNDKIASKVESLFYGLGVAITLGLAKWSVTKKVWNSTIEPWLVDLIDNIVGSGIRGFIKGLRSDR
tara:strand:- start:55 stop:348 length:294 start_codon:yes stop_codon:yes gene_type:complete